MSMLMKQHWPTASASLLSLVLVISCQEGPTARTAPPAAGSLDATNLNVWGEWRTLDFCRKTSDGFEMTELSLDEEKSLYTETRLTFYDDRCAKPKRGYQQIGLTALNIAPTRSNQTLSYKEGAIEFRIQQFGMAIYDRDTLAAVATGDKPVCGRSDWQPGRYLSVYGTECDDDAMPRGSVQLGIWRLEKGILKLRWGLRPNEAPSSLTGATEFKHK